MNKEITPALFIKKFNEELIPLGSAAIHEHNARSDYDYAVSESQWRKLFSVLTETYHFRFGKGSSGSAESKKEFPMFNQCNIKLKYQGTDFDFIVYNDDKIHLVDEAMSNYIRFHNTFHDRSLFSNKSLRIQAFQYFLHTAFGVLKNENAKPNTLLSDLDAIFGGGNIIEKTKNVQPAGPMVQPVAKPVAKPITKPRWDDDEDNFFSELDD